MMNHYARNVTNLLARVLIYSLSAVVLGAVFWRIAETDGSQEMSSEQAKATFGAAIFTIQVFFLLPFSSISSFFFDKRLFAAESSIGLYPAWIYSLCQVILETWVMSTCALTSTVITVPMMGLWNPSLPKSASFITMFAVFGSAGIVGNSLVLVSVFYRK